MKRLLSAALLVAAILNPLPVAAADQHDWRWDECRFRNYSGGPAWNRTEMQLAARCIEAQYPVPGGVPKLFDVIDCESGWGPNAVSPTGQYRGLMQLGSSEFANNLGPPRWDLRRNVFNPRSNLAAGIRLAHHAGWGPWTCA